jgi:nitronate monooxygenase
MLKHPLPIIQAPMAGGFTTVELVSAVANAGGCGSFGFAYTEPKDIVTTAKETRKRTSGAFAINLFLHASEPTDEAKLNNALAHLKPLREKYDLPLIPNLAPKISLENQFEAVLEAKSTVFSSTLGAPSLEMIRACKARNIQVSGTATTLEEAEYLQDLGVDFIVLQGREAGGHRGTFLHELETRDIGLFALLELCAPKIKTPLIAAGGIMSGRGVKAALQLGATAAQIGTAFMVTHEAGTSKPHRDMLLNSTNETVLTHVYTGRPARGIRNALYDALLPLKGQTPNFDVMNALTRDIRAASQKQDDAQFMSLWAGEGYRACKAQSVNELMAELTNIL